MSDIGNVLNQEIQRTLSWKDFINDSFFRRNKDYNFLIIEQKLTRALSISRDIESDFRTYLHELTDEEKK